MPRLAVGNPPLFSSLGLLPASRDEFERQKAIRPDALTDILRAVRFYYLQQLTFAGRITRFSFGTSSIQPARLNPLRIEARLEAVQKRLARVYLECLPYSEVIARYDSKGTFFYIDPPYMGCEKEYGPDVFARTDFAELAALLRTIQGRFVLSLNDTPQVRRIFEGFCIESVTTRYSVENGANTKVGEVLISGG